MRSAAQTAARTRSRKQRRGRHRRRGVGVEQRQLAVVAEPREPGLEVADEARARSPPRRRGRAGRARAGSPISSRISQPIASNVTSWKLMTSLVTTGAGAGAGAGADASPGPRPWWSPPPPSRRDDVGDDLRPQHLAVSLRPRGRRARQRRVVARAQLERQELEGHDEEGERGGDGRQCARPPPRARGSRRAGFGGVGSVTAALASVAALALAAAATAGVGVTGVPAPPPPPPLVWVETGVPLPLPSSSSSRSCASRRGCWCRATEELDEPLVPVVTGAAAAVVAAPTPLVPVVTGGALAMLDDGAAPAPAAPAARLRAAAFGFIGLWRTLWIVRVTTCVWTFGWSASVAAGSEPFELSA